MNPKEVEYGFVRSVVATVITELLYALNPAVEYSENRETLLKQYFYESREHVHNALVELTKGTSLVEEYGVEAQINAYMRSKKK